MDEEGQKVGPAKLKASLMLSKGQQCMESVKIWENKNYQINIEDITGTARTSFKRVNIKACTKTSIKCKSYSNLIDGAPHVTWTAIPSVINNVITCSRLQKLK